MWRNLGARPAAAVTWRHTTPRDYFRKSDKKRSLRAPTGHRASRRPDDAAARSLRVAIITTVAMTGRSRQVGWPDISWWPGPAWKSAGAPFDHRYRNRCHRRFAANLVPEARLELAYLAATDFESAASTIPPLGPPPRPLAAPGHAFKRHSGLRASLPKMYRRPVSYPAYSRSRAISGAGPTCRG